MKRQKNPIEQMIAKFKRAADFEVKRVRGVVEAVDTLEEKGRKIHIVHIANGKMRDSFWLAHSPTAPRAGDQVKGTINTFDDSADFAGEMHKPVFDFENLSASSEDAAFTWLEQHGEAFAKEEETNRRAAQDVQKLCRKLGI